MTRLKCTTGTGDDNLKLFGPTHPFTQQLDIVFPMNESLENILSCLQTDHYIFSAGMCELVVALESFFNTGVAECAMLCVNDTEDVWCIDQRGVLTLGLCKGTYQTLGLIGTQVPGSKNLEERYTVTIPLRRSAESVKVVARRNASLKAWDKRRALLGQKWSIFFTASDPNAISKLQAELGASNATLIRTPCQKSTLSNIQIPVVNIDKLSQPKDEDWCEETNELFEWVGMAGLGSQRLQVNDHVDSFVSMYKPPTPSMHGSVACLRWAGFLGSGFLESIMQAVLKQAVLPPFLAITVHAFPKSPVTFIPPKAMAKPVGTPPRYLLHDSEDTCSVLITPKAPQIQGGQAALHWIQAEVIQKFDGRWG